MNKFNNRYRIESSRLQNWDYGWNASYFITICTANRKLYFGDIIFDNGDDLSPIHIIQLSEIGKLVHQFWLEIPNKFPFVRLDEFVIMPNHVHGILVIDKPNDGIHDVDRRDGRDAINRVSTGKLKKPKKTINNVTESKNIGGITGNKNPMLHENLSRVIRWYKGRTTFESRKIHVDFGWQAGFHDHIIRSPIAHKRIRRYIRNNPKNWNCDRLKEK